MTGFIQGLPAQIIRMIHAAMGHPIVWVALGLVVFGAVVIGGMQLHLYRTNRRAAQSAAARYTHEEIH